MNKAKSKSCAVIIPHYNDVDRLQVCLDVLFSSDTQDAEIVVVDNESTDDLTAVKVLFPDVRFVDETRKGAAFVRNRGVEETTAPSLAFLDSDCVPAADWLDIALRLAPTDAAIGGRIDVFHETDPPYSGAQVFEAAFGFDQRSYVEKKGFSVTANLLTSRDVFSAVGPFRGGVSEDLDWCHRANDMGFAISYAEDLVVGHPSRADWSELQRKWQRLTAESFGLLPDGAASRMFWAGRALLMLPSAFAHIPKILKRSEFSVLERLRGLGTLFRLRLTRMVWMFRQSLTGRP